MQGLQKFFTLDTILSLVRAVLKIGAGWLLARGLADESMVEAVTAGAMALVAILWGIFHRAPVPPAPPRTLLVLAFALPLLGIGCASFNTRAFHAERLTTDAAYAALTAWKAYYQHIPPEQQGSLSNHNVQVYHASKTFAAAMLAAESMREACATNSAASNRNAFRISLEVAREHASNLVWMVRNFPKGGS